MRYINRHKGRMLMIQIESSVYSYYNLHMTALKVKPDQVRLTQYGRYNWKMKIKYFFQVYLFIQIIKKIWTSDAKNIQKGNQLFILKRYEMILFYMTVVLPNYITDSLKLYQEGFGIPTYKFSITSQFVDKHRIIFRNSHSN